MPGNNPRGIGNHNNNNNTNEIVSPMSYNSYQVNSSKYYNNDLRGGTKNEYSSNDIGSK